jgi:exodeoxyribonuclease VII small subunit
MKRLEEVVAEMEKGELPLETLIARHEEGSRLVQICTELLDSARKRVELVEDKASGVSLKPMDVGVAEQPPQPSARTKDKNIAKQKNETHENENGLF